MKNWRATLVIIVKRLLESTPINFYEGEEKEKINEHIQKVLDEGYTEVKAWLTSKSGERGSIVLYSFYYLLQGKKMHFWNCN